MVLMPRLCAHWRWAGSWAASAFGDCVTLLWTWACECLGMPSLPEDTPGSGTAEGLVSL